MHPNPAYRGVEAGRNLDFARSEAFGVLTMAGAEGPLVSHIPFVLNEAGDSLGGHIVRSNPIWKALRDGPLDAVMIVSGPHGYISPDWYGVEDQVPTWNYVAVHAYGTFRIVSDTKALLETLRDTALKYEGRLEQPWSIESPDAQFIEGLLNSIVGFEIDLTRIEGKWKLSQNHTVERRSRVVAALRERDDHQSNAVAALMQETLKEATE